MIKPPKENLEVPSHTQVLTGGGEGEQVFWLLVSGAVCQWSH